MPSEKMPKRLNKNPIIDSTAEVRFMSTVPPEAVLGLVYEKIRDKFGEPKSLPILQLPQALREKDENLKYQACYRFERSGNVLLLGPYNVALSTYPYTDWDGALPLLSELLEKLDALRLFASIHRIGLRYVNFFEQLNIFENMTLSLEVNNRSIATQSIVLRTEREVQGFKVITNVSNSAQATIRGQNKQGSMLDLDVIKEHPELKGNSVPKELLRLFAEANHHADDAFFGLLKPEFLNRFEPEY